ncbi:MAG: hypothetical protein CMA63_06100 [Euryarchaeota archaeon]|jgi:hypothetical protein|nr:hypothetical protein [Euryarchaeota archaeon]|tara:strand:+ start:4748 stop:4945 length:198 start_codon:yes stop_codon:yes gene_type:complete
MFPETHFPLNSELIKALDERFPMRDFDTKVTLREIDYHNGQRSVVNFLRDRLEEQVENSFNSTLE